jgi:hypothetical protein
MIYTQTKHNHMDDSESSRRPGADQAAVYCAGEIVEDIVAVNSSDLDNPKSEILQILLQTEEYN